MKGSAPQCRFLEAEWLNLVMLNYEVDPAVLRDRVPVGCELDAWSGHTFISVVGFQFLRTRVLGIAIPFHQDFEEVNLRFYVRRKNGDEWRRGVVFIRELVPRRAIAMTANYAYGENYLAVPMKHAVQMNDADASRSVSYGWKRNKEWESVTAMFRGEPFYPGDGTEESFITEHYWGYARRGDGRTLEYQVEHPRWRVWRTDQARLSCDAASLYGEEFTTALMRQPRTAFVADGSAVIVRRGTLIS